MILKRKEFSEKKPEDPIRLQMKQQELAIKQQHLQVQSGKQQISQMNAVTNSQRVGMSGTRYSLQAQRNGIEANKFAARKRISRFISNEKTKGKYVQPNYGEKIRKIVKSVK